MTKTGRLSRTPSQPSCIPGRANGLPIPKGIPIPNGIIPKLDQLPPKMEKRRSDSSSAYCNGYSTAYTTASSYTVSPGDRRQSLSSFDLFAESPGPASIVYDHAFITDEYQDDASLILDHIDHITREAEDERVSRTKLARDWFDEYTMDSMNYVFVKNDVGSTWKLRRVIQINEESVCIFNEEDHRFEYIDKRSSKVRPHPAYLKMNDNGSSAASPMTSRPTSPVGSSSPNGYGEGHNDGFPDTDHAQVD